MTAGNCVRVPPQWRFVAACFSAVAPLSSNSATGGQDTDCCLAGRPTATITVLDRIGNRPRSSLAKAGLSQHTDYRNCIASAPDRSARLLAQTALTELYCPRYQQTVAGSRKTPDCLILAESYIVHYQKDFPVQSLCPCPVLLCPILYICL